MSAKNTLRAWLKLQPVPFRVKVEYGDGTERTFKLNDSRSRIRDAETMMRGAVEAEALDQEGEVLRIWSCEPSDKLANITAQPSDPLLMCTKFAALLNDAADRAAERHADAYRIAFEAQNNLMARVIDMMRGQSERLAELEDAYHERVMAEGEPAPPEKSESTELVKHILEVAAPMVAHKLMSGDDKEKTS